MSYYFFIAVDADVVVGVCCVVHLFSLQLIWWCFHYHIGVSLLAHIFFFQFIKQQPPNHCEYYNTVRPKIWYQALNCKRYKNKKINLQFTKVIWCFMISTNKNRQYWCFCFSIVILIEIFENMILSRTSQTIQIKLISNSLVTGTMEPRNNKNKQD